MSISNFVLIDTITNLQKSISNGDTFILSRNSLSIIANTFPSNVGSVFLSITGPINASITENNRPYSLFGDRNGSYNGRIFPVGNYTISATAFSRSNRRGVRGVTTTIRFSVIGAPTTTTSTTKAPTTTTSTTKAPTTTTSTTKAPTTTTTISNGTSLNVEGWAKYYNFGVGVDGGGKSKLVSFNNFDELWNDYVSTPSSTPKNYLYTGPDIKGTIPEYRYTKNNRSIYGLGQEITDTTLRFDPGENIILHNFRLHHSPNDLLRIRSVTGMVISNMDLDGGAYWDGAMWIYPTLDGSLDISTQSDLITVMDTIIRNSDKTSLISSSDTAYDDRGKLRVTFNGVYFLNNVQRTPLVRFGLIDLVNCFVTCPNRGTRAQKSIQASTESKVIVRGVSFKDLRKVSQRPSSGVPGEVWFGDVSRVNIVHPDDMASSPNRVWYYPPLNGVEYDVPTMTPQAAELYCLSNNVGTLRGSVPIIK